jgi:hypothetical protein
MGYWGGGAGPQKWRVQVDNPKNVPFALAYRDIGKITSKSRCV